MAKKEVYKVKPMTEGKRNTTPLILRKYAFEGAAVSISTPVEI